MSFPLRVIRKVYSRPSCTMMSSPRLPMSSRVVVRAGDKAEVGRPAGSAPGGEGRVVAGESGKQTLLILSSRMDYKPECERFAILLTAPRCCPTMALWRKLTVYVCLCHGITERQVRECIEEGAQTLYDLQGQLGVATNCGSCAGHACEMLQEHRAGRALADPALHCPGTLMAAGTAAAV
jgi:bacterioferritin-associated ferredoxin